MGIERWIWALLMTGLASMTQAGSVSLGESRAAPLLGGREAVPLIQTALTGAQSQSGRGSLFAGKMAGGLLAPYAPRRNTPGQIASGQIASGQIVPGMSPHGGALAEGVRGLMALIAKAEAGPAGYDAVVWSARIKPPKQPTDMTLREIYAWINATPRQNHAIGRYQFIPKTLRWLVARLDVPLEARFTPELQDRLAFLLLQDAGLEAFEAGDMAQVTFMDNLAKTWAGLPNSSGKSHYHGFAGNKATMTWDYFNARMRQIFQSG